MIQWHGRGNDTPLSDLGYQSPVLGNKPPKSATGDLDLDAVVAISSFEQFKPGTEARFIKADDGWKCVELCYDFIGPDW